MSDKKGGSHNEQLGLVHSEKFKADASHGPAIGSKTQRPTTTEYGGKNGKK